MIIGSFTKGLQPMTFKEKDQGIGFDRTYD